jgi:hypothetical protein
MSKFLMPLKCVSLLLFGYCGSALSLLAALDARSSIGGGLGLSVCLEKMYIVAGMMVVPCEFVVLVLNALTSDQLCCAIRLRSVAAGVTTSQNHPLSSVFFCFAVTP